MRDPGEAPPADALIIREGKVKPAQVVIEEAEADRAERSEAGTWDGRYQLSVFAGLLGADESLDAAAGRLHNPHRKVKFYRTTSLDQLVEAGFRVVASPPEPYHYDVVLGETVDEAVVERFDGCFSEARRNQLWRSK